MKRPLESSELKSFHERWKLSSWVPEEDELLPKVTVSLPEKL